jgi:hypothetical protein
MNKNLKRLLILATLPFLCCGGCSRDTSGKFIMTATITAINSHIEVEILTDQYNSGIMWVNASNLTAIYDANGKKIKLNDLRVGDKIQIEYSGQVMMSYPGQITAKKITVLKNTVIS